MSAMDMHGAELGAAMQGGHGLGGVQQASGVEGGLDGMELGQLLGLELDAHLVDLFLADAMLARDGATHLDAQLQDLAAQLSKRIAHVLGFATNGRNDHRD